MPKYTVIAPGFYEGELYSPTGKRNVVTTAAPFGKGKLPSWLTTYRKPSTKPKYAEVNDDKATIAAASTLGAGEADTSFLESGTVETL